MNSTRKQTILVTDFMIEKGLYRPNSDPNAVKNAHRWFKRNLASNNQTPSLTCIKRGVYEVNLREAEKSYEAYLVRARELSEQRREAAKRLNEIKAQRKQQAAAAQESAGTRGSPTAGATPETSVGGAGRGVGRRATTSRSGGRRSSMRSETISPQPSSNPEPTEVLEGNEPNPGEMEE